MSYEELSDFEINKRVAEYLGFVIFAECDDWFSVLKHHKASSDSEFDPCNNPADAWPIIEQIWPKLMQTCFYDFGVGLGLSNCSRWDGLAHIHGGNKLRAAMICYLMVQEAK